MGIAHIAYLHRTLGWAKWPRALTPNLVEFKMMECVELAHHVAFRRQDCMMHEKSFATRVHRPVPLTLERLYPYIHCGDGFQSRLFDTKLIMNS